MVLSFALCASLAFAQTNNGIRLVRSTNLDKAVKVDKADAKEAGFSGTIFTKEGELYYNSFGDATTFTTGTVGDNEMIGGELAPAHAQSAYHSTWHRWNDSTAAYSESQQQFYPASYDGHLNSRIASLTPMEGIMAMTMQDQVAAWGGSGTLGAFDAYIAFPAFSTVGERLVRVRFYQYYAKFNNDRCYIDYSTDGSTWNKMEINVRNVDIAGNAATRGWKQVTLPRAVANQANVYLRIRWTCSSNSGGAYGYFWFLDDFTVVPSPNDVLTMKSNLMFEGFYHQYPQGLNVPLVWAADFINDGQNDQSNVTGTINYWMDGAESNVITLASRNIGTVASDPEVTRTMVIDPFGWYDSVDAGNHGHGYAYTGTGLGNATYFPTATTGTGHWYTNISTDAFNMIYDSMTFDTLRFTVNHDATYHNGRGTWGRDNGVLTKFSYVTPGTISGSGQNGDPYIWSDDYNSTQFDQPGYGNFVSYITGPQIPQGWKVLGVEMVASTENGTTSPGAKILPYLIRDSVNDRGLSLYYMNTGASTYTVTSNDVLPAEDFQYLTYELQGNYPTIFIPFPNQPDLLPNSSYRIGYRMAEEGNFAVASSRNYFYDEDTTLTRFWNTNGMLSYGHALGIDNSWTVITYDPYRQGYAFFPIDKMPMIRMVVGPAFYVPHYAISFECDNPDEGYFANGRNESLCDLTDSAAQGSTVGVYIYPAEGYEIDKIYVDGAEYSDYEFDDVDGYGYMEIENIQAAHTLRCSFRPKVGIDPVATGVSMKLQPNPATSNVNISLKGVSGNVNMSLIDMSGRVITTSTFSAENGTNLNVSNLAKGAYFVRITNDKFSKVEKLIVR